MILIQCKAVDFSRLCIFFGVEPTIKEEPGGYIDCFDKDWLFIKSNNKKVINYIKSNLSAYLIGLQEKKQIIQRNIGEYEQYIVIRKIGEEHELLWGASSYLNFKEAKQ